MNQSDESDTRIVSRAVNYSNCLNTWMYFTETGGAGRGQTSCRRAVFHPEIINVDFGLIAE